MFRHHEHVRGPIGHVTHTNWNPAIEHAVFVTDICNRPVQIGAHAKAIVHATAVVPHIGATWLVLKIAGAKERGNHVLGKGSIGTGISQAAKVNQSIERCLIDVQLVAKRPEDDEQAAEVEEAFE